jgi:hypothetical protein
MTAIDTHKFITNQNLCRAAPTSLLGIDSAYAPVGFSLSLVTFVILITAVALDPGPMITLLGLPVLVATLVALPELFPASPTGGPTSITAELPCQTGH